MFDPKIRKASMLRIRQRCNADLSGGFACLVDKYVLDTRSIDVGPGT